MIEEMGVVLVIAAEVGLEIDAGDLIKKKPGIDVVDIISIVHRPDCTCTILNIRK